MLQVRWVMAFCFFGVTMQGCCKQCESTSSSAPVPVEKDAEPMSEPEPLIQEVTSKSGGGEEKAVGDTLRIATYNIQNLTDGYDDGWGRTKLKTRRQIENAAKVIDQINADILTIQEIENMTVLSRLNSKLTEPYAHLYISEFNSTRRDTKLNIALLSRIPLLEVVELDFNAVQEAPVHLSRGTVRFMAALEEGRTLLGYAVHLKSNHGEHEENMQKRKISTEIIRTDADSVVAANPDQIFEIVVLGDTNVDPDLSKWADDPSLTPFEDWNDLWRGVPIEVRTTLDQRQGDPDLAYDPVAFDRIIASPALSETPWVIEQPTVTRAGVDTNNVYVSPGENDIHVSDHYPVYTDIKK